MEASSRIKISKQPRYGSLANHHRNAREEKKANINVLSSRLLIFKPNQPEAIRDSHCLSQRQDRVLLCFPSTSWHEMPGKQIRRQHTLPCFRYPQAHFLSIEEIIMTIYSCIVLHSVKYGRPTVMISPVLPGKKCKRCYPLVRRKRVLGTDIFTSIASSVVVFTLQKMLDIHYPEAFPSPKQLIA